jgi:hypothetical protein
MSCEGFGRLHVDAGWYPHEKNLIRCDILRARQDIRWTSQIIQCSKTRIQYVPDSPRSIDPQVAYAVHRD